MAQQIKHSSTPWWRSDLYEGDFAIPGEVATHAGPKGVALVKAWPSGTTDEGWGLNPPKSGGDGFMPRYMKGLFDSRRALHGYKEGRWNFALVMRSVRLVCIDIDGKNGGFDHVGKLGMLPPTLAETSKSGDGYHLFYLVDDEWDDELGFGLLGDRIGVEQGVDIRGTGCVYHHPQQRWNHRGLNKLPAHMYDMLKHRDQKVAASNERIAKIVEGDDEVEVLMLQDELVRELAKPIPAGKRNQTLFAIGSQMHLAQVPDWDEKIQEKADDLGLDQAEIDKLIGNIRRYAV